jgi:hypothetical protein
MLTQQNFEGHTGKPWAGASALVLLASRSEDPAWEGDTKRTNYNLVEGDVVRLLSDTKGNFSYGTYLVPTGTLGKVAFARTPRVVRGKNTKSAYFANVEVVIDGQVGRIRVPHGTLKIVR